MRTFESWAGLLAYLGEHSDMVHYQAPLDRYPVPVVVTRKFKNGNVRVTYRGGSFTADPSHLDRFRRKAEASS